MPELYFTVAFVVSYDIGSVSPPTLFFFKTVVATLGHLYFHMNFRISLSSCAKILPRILVKTGLNLQVNLGNTEFLTILSHLIHEQGKSFHLFRSSLIFSIMFCGLHNIRFVLLLLNLFLGI